MRPLLLLATLSLALATLPSGDARPDFVTDRQYDDHGRIVAEVGVDGDDTRVGFTRVYHYPASASAGAGPSASSSALTDCTSTKYRTSGYRWSGPISFTTTAYASQLSTALATWDAATGATISGGVTSGRAGTAGVYDGVNQVDWVALGTGGTIAVTTTWYYRSSGVAVESDAQYNTYYSWSTSGEAGKMDVENIAAHEFGHSFGLSHPRGGGISCLTMYAYGSPGETSKRTLGDGDILGIRALYGA